MIFSKLIRDIGNIAYNYRQSDDDNLSDRQIAFWINSYRSKLAQQELSKGNKLSEAFTQTVEKVEIEKYKSNLGECLYRSVLPIPQPIFSKLKDQLSYVGPEDGSQNFDKLEFHDLQFIKFSKFAKNYPHYGIKDKYLYLYYPPTENIKYISIHGIFEEPEEIEKMKDPFIGFEFEYPIPGYIIPTIKELIMEKELRIGLSTNEDKVNDGA
jgi:hypothetical protein